MTIHPYGYIGKSGYLGIHLRDGNIGGIRDEALMEELSDEKSKGGGIVHSAGPGIGTIME
jgi:hypothetical protein